MNWLGGKIFGEVTATVSVLLCASLGRGCRKGVSGVLVFLYEIALFLFNNDNNALDPVNKLGKH